MKSPEISYTSKEFSSESRRFKLSSLDFFSFIQFIGIFPENVDYFVQILLHKKLIDNHNSFRVPEFFPKDTALNPLPVKTCGLNNLDILWHSVSAFIICREKIELAFFTFRLPPRGINFLYFSFWRLHNSLSNLQVLLLCYYYLLPYNTNR